MSFQFFTLLKTRYTQLGGLRLVRQYAKMGLLWPAANVEGTYEYIINDNVNE